MMCLWCGHDNAYEIRVCENCQEEFEVSPPYIHANHLSQFQSATRSYLEEELELDDLYLCYENFVHVCESYLHASDKHPLEVLVDQLSSAEQQDGERALGALKEGFELLVKLLEVIESVLDSESEPSKEDLHFLLECSHNMFRLLCRGCAELDFLSKKWLKSSGGLVNIQKY